MRPATSKISCSPLSRETGTQQQATKAWVLAALLLAFAFVLSTMAQAQSGFVYVNNQSSSNSVAAYKASATGTLTQIAGSPFLTGGVGSSESCYGLSRLAVSSINNLLFVANTGDKSITPFQINTTTGALTKTTGAPFASGLTADTCQGFSIAVTPDGQFLMAASNGQIRTFTVAANGALAFLSSTPNCCSPITGLSLSPDGRFLAVSNGTSISMFTVSAGVLTSVPGSPFAKLGSGSLSAIDFSCLADSNGNLRLYSGEATTTPTAEGWLVDPSGVLTPTTASPYHSSGTNSNNVVLSPDNTLLFQSNQSSTSINSFLLNPDGSLINSGKFGTTGQVHTPVGMSIDQSGTFLYVADDLFGVAAFRIGDGGMLAWLQDLGITRPGQIRDVAAFPPRSCTTADVVLGVDAPTIAGAGVPIRYTVTVTNNGPANASAVVSDILPAELTAGGNTLIANPSGASRVNADGTPNVTGTVTITTTVPHQLVPNEKVTIASVPAPSTPNPIQQGFFLTDPAFNGVVTVGTVPSPTTFTYTQVIPRSQFPAPTLQIVASNGAQRIANTVTITATQVFQLAPGTPITISGVANSSFNGSYTVQSQPTANTLTYVQTGTLADAVSGGGIVTAPINVPATDTAGGGSASSPACQVTTGPGACSTATFAPRPPIVTAIRSGNVVTITTTVPHLMAVGKSVTIQGVANTSFNGTFTITSVPSPTSFTYNQTAANASSTGGLVVAPNVTAQLITFSNIPTDAANQKREAVITGTTSSSITNGTVVSNRVTISNLSVVDNPPGDTTVSKDVTIGSSGISVITVPAATGPYGGTAVVTATLLDGNGLPIAGANVGFNFNQNNSQYNAVTDGSGVATASVPLGFTTVGTHANAFTATFGGDATHTGSSATADLVVTKANLTVTADNQARLYGDPNPPLTYTITGFVNQDTIAVVSGTADCSTTATVTSPVGTYPITCTQGTLSATNYNFVFVDGTLTVNPAPLTVTVDNATRVYGDANPTFTGTITGIKNGDNITATYSTTATITSFVGTYPITATLSDNGTGALANYIVTTNNGTLTITPAPLVVTANNAGRLYGDPNPPFSGTISGIKNNDPITAAYTSPATETSPVGSYPIIPTLSDNGSGTLVNYTVTVNNGVLLVTPAPLTVTAANASRPYGQPNPVFTGTIVGIKNNDPITATYSTTATQTSPVGTYPIVPTVSDGGTGLLSNYSVTLVNGTLTITQAVLTVNVNSASMIYGDPLPVFTGTITGIVNGDNITATYSTTATSASPIGTYPITATLSDNGTGALANYSVVINNGVLTINPAPLTVNVDSTSRLYGDANPAFTGAIIGIKNADPITAIFSTTADPTSAVGTYPINATVSDGGTGKLTNYTVTINPGTLTINPAPLTVTADNASKLFGTVNPPLSGVITGIKNSDPITATYSTTAVATSPVATYPITPALNDPAGKLGNYTVTSNNGTLTVNPAPTANFLFVNNQAATGNSINGYSVAVDGTLTALAGSPTVTGGLGANVACSSVNRLALSAGNNLLFVSNGGDQTISAFSIDPTSGALTPAAGSPFASGLTLDTCNGISLAATPDGQFLMASSNGQIKTFSIGAGGVLTAVSTASNPASPNSSMKISANGQLLAVSNGTSVSVYTISGDGSLSPVVGSPFAETGTATLAGLDFSSTSGLLYGAEASATGAFADAWTVGANGALSAVTGSPFSDTNLNSNVVLLSPADGFLFASNSGSANVSSYTVGAGGVLTNVVSAGSLHSPVGMASDRSGTLLFVADDTFGVGVFNIGGTGSLTQLNDTAISGAGQVQDLVAYPPRMASNADLSVAITASSANVVAGNNMSFTITVTNNGADPAAATVTDALPSGFSVVSCSATGNGACIGNTGAATFYLLQSGESQTVTLVTSTSLAIPDGTIANNSVSVSNSSAVDANAANNSASVSVTVSQPITTVLTVAAASGTYGGNTTLSATLTDSGSNPIAGKTINFSLNGTTVGSAVTDTFGAASVPASLVGINAGSFPNAVTASFAGDPNHKPSSGSATLTVNPALLTVTAGNASRVYGDANPAFAFSITGFVNGETSAVLTGTPVCTTAADPTSPVGSYPITCTQGTLSAQNYTFTFVAGALNITPAPLSVTPANASRLYGDPNPTLTGTITGLKNGDNITAVYSTTATQISPVGTYPITAGLVDPTNKLGNYTVTLNNGVLTINPAPLTVTATNATMPFGGPLPTLTGTITGIRNGDNITATFTTTATANSPVGTYPITPALSDNGTGALRNYAVTANNGVLTVTQTVLTVTAANASMIYGDPLPAFTGTITGIQNGDNITATYTTVATSASPVGTYAIVPVLSDNGTGALANYTVVVNNGTLTINPAPLSVAAANASMIYGNPVPALTGTVTGIKNGDNITATFATTATSASPVGSYAIVPTLVDPTNKLGNYTVTSSNGTLAITPAPLSVTAANASRLYGSPNPTLTGTITGLKNGDNITAVYSTTATQISPVGTYPITVGLVDPTNKLGNYAVTLNNGVLTVAPAPLTVTAANATMPFGGPLPTLTGTITGIKNGDNITATFATTATASSPVGTYPIVPTLSDNGTGALANYAVTVNNGNLTITQSVLTVTAANASMIYGDPLPVFTGTITGIQNGDNITATYTTVATSASPVGTYAIVPVLSDNGTGALANYTIVVNNGTLTINPAPLSVTAANASMIYGDPVPALTGAIVGIKNGDNITATFATTATSASPVGTYPIVPTLLDPTNKLGNYTVTSVAGTLTINPAPLTVTADNASKLFGTVNPPLNGVITGIKNADPITATFSTTATATSPAGTYPITPSLTDPAGKLGNYTVTSNNGTLTVNPAPIANFVFVNNQAASGNSINGYSVAVDGTLTALAGSPTLTGGLGANAACSSVNRLALSAGNNLLFVSNGGDQTISAFSINPASGALTAAGTPVASGLTLDACSGISLAATPDGQFLMASSNGQIKTFSIGAGGVLTAVSTASNPATPNSSMKVSANGQFLAVSNGTSVSVYTINPDGSLTAVAGSPFAKTGTATLAGLDFSSTSGLLFGAEADPTSSLADAWTVGGNGVLSAVAGSPFSIGAINSSAVLLSPNDAFLFASNQGSANVSSFSSAAGSLSSLGSFGTLHSPVGMATDRSGSLLYVADDTFGLAVFSINGAGSLAQLSDNAISGAGQVQDLVAYPPRMASNADLSVSISASSPTVVAGQSVTYTITITNNGAEPAAATIANVLPAGFTQTSCSATGNGACIGNSGAANFYLLQSGESQTVTIAASISLSIADGTVATDSVSISNASAVDANAGNNSASTNVTVGQPSTTTLAVAPASGTYGGSTTLSATLSATSGALSGKTVSFSLNGVSVGTAVTNASGVATLSTPLGTIGAGLHAGAVSASFAGDANNKASSGSADLTVNPAPLTVTAANASRAYGGPNPALTGTITGIQNGDNITATYSTTAVATSPVGTYAIVPALSDNGTGALANYVVSSTNGTLTVTPALLTVTAANATMVFGDPVPALTGTITGIRNGENITASYSTIATSTSNVGTYAIIPAVTDNGTGVLANYTVSLNNGTLTITPAPLTVTAANASMIYGDAVPALSGTITGIRNGNNITATYSTTATSASPVGTYPIVPTLSDNGTGALANYSVTSNDGTLTITPAPLTITAANASMIYGDPLPAFSGTITGIKNADNITATYSTAATSASNVGTYAIVPAPSDNGTGKLTNYTVTLVNGTLTINPAPLSVTAANATRVYGDPNPTFTGTITGLKNGDNITFSATSADATAAVGTYPIVPALVDPNGKLVNYTVTPTNGTLTVTPAPLTVTAANASMVFGDPVPTLTGTVTGIKNGDNITGVYTTTATSASPVGTYPITAAASDNGTGKLTNYTVTPANATLTITPAPLTVTAANASMVFGDPVPALTGTITGIKNGNNITATYSTTATSTSNVGTYPITPALSDNGTGALANYTVNVVGGTLTVNRAPLTVTAANASMIYGDPVPALSGTITGIRNGNNITATYSTTATSTSPVGTYPIVPALSDNATGALANYTVTSNNGTLTINQAPLTITAASASMIYGDPLPAFSGTITGIKNADNITATYSTTATSASNVGSYAITPVPSDNGTGKLTNYAVTLVNGTLTITPAPLSATANNATRVYGDPNPAFTGTITGLKNGDNITFGATSADATAAVGTYPIVPALVDPNGKLVNYTVTPTNGTLTVTPAPLTVTAANGSMVFGDPVPTLTGTVTGIKNGDNITGVYTTTATSTSSVGSYPITAAASDNGTGKLANYTVTPVSGTLTINPAPLTVAGANAAMIYGDPVPAVTGTITGLKNGNTIGATFSTPATSASPVGNYAIIPTVTDPNNVLSNYTLTVVNGVLQISPAPLTVTAASVSRLYGDPNPVFTGTVTGIKNGDNITATYSSATDPTTTVGTYPIVPAPSDNGTGALANYAVTSNNGTLTINPAPLTIQANDATAPVGGPFPTFTGTITGLKNGDAITASYSTTANATSPAGQYPITPSADANPLLVNYALTLINGTLTLQ